MSKGWDCQGPKKGPQGVARTIQKQKKTGKCGVLEAQWRKYFKEKEVINHIQCPEVRQGWELTIRFINGGDWDDLDKSGFEVIRIKDTRQLVL